MPTADEKPGAPSIVSVPIGGWAVAQAPGVIRTLLGSCVGVVLHDRQGRIGGLAHVVLPDSRGCVEHPGKYADTAVPAMIDDLERLAGRKLRPRLCAKLFGGASMFQTTSAPLEIGRLNQAAVERTLAALGVPVIARDVGGDAGRRLTFDTASGMVSVKVPGRVDYEL